MKRLIILALIGALGWQGYSTYQTKRALSAEAAQETTAPTISDLTRDDQPSQFSCDGRTHCSQMTSCAEATYFLKNCPGAKMDGNHDGVPCEQQFCGR